MTKIAVVNGKKSVGFRTTKRGHVLYCFESFGKRYWCGDFESLRGTALEAEQDAINKQSKNGLCITKQSN